MVSEKEVEAAREVLERHVFDEGGCEVERVPAMVREMLEAAALVRAEDNAGEPVAWGEEIGGKIVSVRLDKSQHCTVPLYRSPQPSGPVATLERGDGKGGWIIPVDVLSEIQKDAGEWADETYLETVEAIALAVERRLSALTAGKPEQVPSRQPETVDSVLLDAVRKIASTDLSGCADMTTAEIFGALSRMHETARGAVEAAERILGRDEGR